MRRGTAALVSLLSAAVLPGSVSAGSARHSVQPPRCAATHLARVPHSAWVRAGRQLAPAGADAIRLCRYGSAAVHPPAKLVRSRLVARRSLVHKLLRDVNRLPPMPSGTCSCPADHGSQILALLAYPDGKRVTIQAGLTGCRVVTNGDKVQWAVTGAGPDVLAELEQLTRPGA